MILFNNVPNATPLRVDGVDEKVVVWFVHPKGLRVMVSTIKRPSIHYSLPAPPCSLFSHLLVRPSPSQGFSLIYLIVLVICDSPIASTIAHFSPTGRLPTSLPPPAEASKPAAHTTPKTRGTPKWKVEEAHLRYLPNWRDSATSDAFVMRKDWYSFALESWKSP